MSSSSHAPPVVAPVSPAHLAFFFFVTMSPFIALECYFAQGIDQPCLRHRLAHQPLSVQQFLQMCAGINLSVLAFTIFWAYCWLTNHHPANGVVFDCMRAFATGRVYPAASAMAMLAWTFGVVAMVNADRTHAACSGSLRGFLIALLVINGFVVAGVLGKLCNTSNARAHASFTVVSPPV